MSQVCLSEKVWLLLYVGTYCSCGISPNDIFRPLRLYKTCKIRCTQIRHAPDIWIESTSSYPSNRYIIYCYELPLNRVCSKWSIERVYSATVPSTGNWYFVCETYETTAVATNTITGRRWLYTHINGSEIGRSKQLMLTFHFKMKIILKDHAYIIRRAF